MLTVAGFVSSESVECSSSIHDAFNSRIARSRETMNDPKPETQPDYRVEAFAPGDLTAAEMERCATIIIDGEAIENPDSVKTWLPRSVALAVVRKGRGDRRRRCDQAGTAWLCETSCCGKRVHLPCRLAGTRVHRTRPGSQEQQIVTAHPRRVVGTTWRGTDLGDDIVGNDQGRHGRCRIPPPGEGMGQA
jgi:hypothetical protein